MRVFLIDDHALFRGGLQELLQRLGVDVVGAEGDCRKGIDDVAALEPEVVLLDMRMPDMDGVEVLRELRTRCPAIPVAMLTTSREEADVIESLQNGAQGYLLKEMEPEELVDALQQIVAGNTVVAKELTAILARAVQGETESPASKGGLDELTPREREILCQLVEGRSNKVIARHLGISDGTVKLHVKAILRKLGVHSRVEAAVIAVEQNICSREGAN
jgi:two-component system nitrate/nitrite response regulator NarL